MAAVPFELLRLRLQEVQRRADRHTPVRRQPVEEQEVFGPFDPQRNRPQNVRNRSRRRDDRRSDRRNGRSVLVSFVFV